MSDNLINIEAVQVEPGRVTMDVRAAAPVRYTSVELMERVLRDFPNLLQHTCVNAEGPTFASVMTHTSTPHLLEHLIIDLQVSDQATNSTHTFAGHTSWIDEPAGLACVSVSFHDDACALRAIQEAQSYLCSVL